MRQRSRASRSCRSRVATRPGTEATAKKYGIPHWSSYNLDREHQPARRRGRDPGDADAAAPAQALECMRAGKHVEIEIPMADSLADSEEICARAAGDGPRRDGRPHAPLQPEPPVDPRPRRGRRAQAAAAQGGDVLLPPHQHERGGAASELGGPPALAPRLSHGRPVPVPDAARGLGGARYPGPDKPGAQHRDGHERSR